MGKLQFYILVSFSFLFPATNLSAQGFKENKGQWPKHVFFAAEAAAGNIYIEQSSLTYQLFALKDLKLAHDNRDKEVVVHGHNYKMEFVNGNLDKKITGQKKTEYYNYFMGNDQSRWASDVKAYEDVLFKQVYPGVDIKFYDNMAGFKYDFVIAPHADISIIKLRYKYVDALLLANNRLLIATSIGTVIESIPKAYQVINGKEVPVECNYLVKNNEVSFFVGKTYNPQYELVIDPTVVVASYSGTESVSFGLGVKPDEKGNMYLYSMNITKNYPVTPGAVQTNYGGGYMDCTLSKFNSTGNVKYFSTYIGGNKEEYIINCDVRGAQVAVFGTTLSDTFPVIQNGFQPNYTGQKDFFVIKLDTSGKILLGSSYLGGKKQEGIPSVANGTAYYPVSPGELIMDANYDCYIIGNSTSFDFPTTPGAFKRYADSTNFGDMVIVKINSGLTQLYWSTYFGGSYAEMAGGLKLSKEGRLYCAGSSASADFFTTPGAAYPSKINLPDLVAFVLDTVHGFPLYSTYLGSRGTDVVSRVTLDQGENFYISATTNLPSTMTLTPGTYNASNGDVMFIKMKSDLSQVNALSRFGYASSQTKAIEIDALAVDSCGNIYFGGFGLPGLPVTPNAFKSVAAAKGNMYVGIFNPNFSSLKFASYFGSNALQFEDHDDGGLNYFDNRGYFYHAACVADDWPVTAGAYSGYNVKDSIVNGPYAAIKNSDAFVKIDLNTFVNVTSTLGGEIKSCSPVTTTFVASANLGTISIDPGDGSGAVNTPSLVHTYNVFGTYTAMVVAGTDTTTCNQSDSIRTIIKYGARPVAALPDSTNNCYGIPDALNAQNEGASYLWNTGQVSQIISPHKTGKYFVNIDNGFCSILDSSYVTMLEAEYPIVLPNIITPNGDNINDCWDLSKYAISDMDFVIYDRWGVPVFVSKKGDTKWCGYNQRGERLSDGTYFWILNCRSDCKPQNKVTEKGFIQIFR